MQQQALGRSHLVVDTAPAHRNDDPAPGVQQQIDLIRPNAQLCVGLPAATGPEAVQFRKLSYQNNMLSEYGSSVGRKQQRPDQAGRCHGAEPKSRADQGPSRPTRTSVVDNLHLRLRSLRA